MLAHLSEQCSRTDRTRGLGVGVGRSGCTKTTVTRFCLGVRKNLHCEYPNFLISSPPAHAEREETAWLADPRVLAVADGRTRCSTVDEQAQGASRSASSYSPP